MQRSAEISECGTYRFRLDRQWLPQPCRPMLVCMLNPSTADADRDDATITKLSNWMVRNDFGRLIVVNLYPFRATKPADLKAAQFPNPSRNAEVIREAIRETVADLGVVFAAWGANARGRPEAAHFLQGAREDGALPFAFRLLSDGTPEHPLYIPYAAQPVARVRA